MRAQWGELMNGCRLSRLSRGLSESHCSTVQEGLNRAENVWRPIDITRALAPLTSVKGIFWKGETERAEKQNHNSDFTWDHLQVQTTERNGVGRRALSPGFLSRLDRSPTTTT